MPFNKLKQWLIQEKELGVNDPYSAVLSTCDQNATPHSRVVAIREIEAESLIFFTQRKTRKVTELKNNPKACFNFLLSLQNRQVIIEGEVLPLEQKENEAFWSTLPRERQLRFTTYAPTSGQAIDSLEQLEQRKKDLAAQFTEQSIPMSADYLGFRFIPQNWIFYTIGTTTFSEVLRYTKEKNSWTSKLHSP